MFKLLLQQRCFSSSKHGYREIEAIVNLNQEHCTQEYWDEIYNRQTPFIFKGLNNEWPALTDGDEKQWTLQQLQKRAGSQVVCIEAYGDYMSKNMKQVHIDFDSYIDFLSTGKNDHFYLAQTHLDEFPTIKNDVKVPKLCNTGKKTLYRTNIWLGPKGIYSPCHIDPFQNILCQILGTKKVVLFPNDQSKFLYPAVGTLQKNTSLVDVENPDLERFPSFEKAQGYEAVLHPGDALFIPYKYWHYCRALLVRQKLSYLRDSDSSGHSN
eukprot:gene412-746_t